MNAMDNDAATAGVSNEVENALIAQYEYYYKQLTLTSSGGGIPIDRLEKEVQKYNAAVRLYEKRMRDRNEAALHKQGGIARLTTLTDSLSNSALQTVDLGPIVSKVWQIGLDKKPPPKKIFACKIPALISPAQALELIRLSESIGYRNFIRNVPEGTTAQSKPEPARTHTACTVHSLELAAWIWHRVAPLVKDVTRDFSSRHWKPHCINPCMRFSRYAEGQLFETHTDDVHEKFDRRPPERSFFTVVLYLNEGFESGSLRYVTSAVTKYVSAESADRIVHTVMPTTGLCMIFQHDLLHEALPPRGPIPKYILRTDVVFTGSGAAM